MKDKYGEKTPWLRTARLPERGGMGGSCEGSHSHANEERKGAKTNRVTGARGKAADWEGTMA